MTIDFGRGDLFTSDARYYGHGVNLQGKMGAGIAKRFREVFPLNYLKYQNKCSTGSLRLGTNLIHVERRADTGRFHTVVNMATQVYPGPDARTSAVRATLRGFVNFAESLAGSRQPGADRIALPMVGCGIGGLDWESQVLPAIEQVAKTTDITFEIWEL